MPEKPATTRSRGIRRTVTIDLRADHYDRLVALAQAKDLPASTLARLLLLPALAEANGDAA